MPEQPMPEWATKAAEDAGVSLEGWEVKGNTVAFYAGGLNDWIWIHPNGSIDLETCDTRSLPEAIRLADRLRKVLEERKNDETI